METIAELSLAVVSARFFVSLVIGCALVINASREDRDFEVSIGVVQGLRFKSKKPLPFEGIPSPGRDSHFDD